ncbi:MULTISPECIES: sugar O-acetyltransferase [Vibrio]|uniref:Nodulation protein L n=1 Tax=Vibrio algicola TaxID=2662262 RepID=A0A5Q0TI64_9VIBR|nr:MULTISPECIES: sugar O-acetyltransferase [Vibrio]MBD1575926.1 sugar O-acetyltransferase [Vibrio sp. S11_S32]
MTEFEKMLAGQDFDGLDASIADVREKTSKLKLRLNQSITMQDQHDILKEMLGSIGEQSIISPPFCCEFGKSIFVGENTFINMNVVMLDNASITIGDHVLIAPSVQFYTASHSMDYRSRHRWETFSKPIVVEDDVWIGGNTVINQGVTIGARSVIAANSVVNQDVPPDCLYGGTPARLIRKLDGVED